MVYKTVGDTQLHLHIFRPTKQRTKAPAVVSFWRWLERYAAQFEQQCRYLASRGMVAMTAEYRTRNMHGTLATACVADGKSAVRWIRRMPASGVDPDRIAAGGGSAGGHVAACTGVIDGFESEDEDDKISSALNAMVLFNRPVFWRRFPEK